MNYTVASPSAFAVHEPMAKIFGLNERSLERWWRKWSVKSKNLRTTEGESLIIVDPGQLNDGPGPDMANASIILGDYSMTGAVEFHVQARDWYQHGHASDPAYKRVILHVVMRDGGGPDLPTVLVPESQLGSPSCLAQRPASSQDLLPYILARFAKKQAHIALIKNRLHDQRESLAAGLFEVLCAGPGRRRLLHEAAVTRGWEYWPGAQAWQGSGRAFPGRGEPAVSMDKLFNIGEELMQVDRAIQSKKNTLSAWPNPPERLLKLRISQAQFQEWLVNHVFPGLPNGTGLDLWFRLKPFRKYGFERGLSKRLNLTNRNSIAIQQGMIQWDRVLCKPSNCEPCPLRHS